MEKFAFVIHPLDARQDVARKFPIARYLPERVVEFGLKQKRPQTVGHCVGIRSNQGVEAEGWFIACPLSARQILQLPDEFVYERIVQCGEIAMELGAGIMGLGAFTSVVGDGGITVADRLPIAITTGNSYTVATAVEATIKANDLLGRSMEESAVAVIGATGSIGRTCAMMLGRSARTVTLVGRRLQKLEETANEVRADGAGHVQVTTDINTALKTADIVITVTSAVEAVIMPEHLKPGAIVCDVARPRDVSVKVARERKDVLVIEGGVVKVPGEKVDLGFNFGFEPGTAYACMSETMMLALAGRYEDFSLGKQISVEQVRETQRLANEQGFTLAGFRSFEKPVTDESIARVMKHMDGNHIR